MVFFLPNENEKKVYMILENRKYAARMCPIWTHFRGCSLPFCLL